MQPEQTNTVQPNIPDKRAGKKYAIYALITLVLWPVLWVLQAFIPFVFFLAFSYPIFAVPAFIIFTGLAIYRLAHPQTEAEIQKAKAAKEAVDSEGHYKKGLKISLLATLPGILIFLWAMFEQQQGTSGTEFIVLALFPVFLVSLLGLISSFIYSIALLITTHSLYIRLACLSIMVAEGMLAFFWLSVG